MTTPLVLCNKCNNLYIDNNPQKCQKEYDIMIYPITEELELFPDGHEWFYGCPKCSDDSNLCDFTGDLDDFFAHNI